MKTDSIVDDQEILFIFSLNRNKSGNVEIFLSLRWEFKQTNIVDREEIDKSGLYFHWWKLIGNLVKWSLERTLFEVEVMNTDPVVGRAGELLYIFPRQR